MTIKTKLPNGISLLFEQSSKINFSDLTDLKEALDSFIEEQEAARDEKSERWLEGDKAASHEDWLSRLGEVRDSLDGVIDALNELDLTNPPEYEG